MLGAYLALLLALLIVRPDFYRHQFFDTWVSAAPTLVVAVGMTLVIVAREIDISVGSIFSVCAVVAALAAKQRVPMPLVVPLAILCGAIIGAANGLFVAFLRLPSIIVTLAMMVILREGLAWAREGEAVRDLPNRFQWFGLSQTGGEVVLIVDRGRRVCGSRRGRRASWRRGVRRTRSGPTPRRPGWPAFGRCGWSSGPSC